MPWVCVPNGCNMLRKGRSFKPARHAAPQNPHRFLRPRGLRVPALARHNQNQPPVQIAARQNEPQQGGVGLFLRHAVQVEPPFYRELSPLEPLRCAAIQRRQYWRLAQPFGGSVPRIGRRQGRQCGEGGMSLAVVRSSPGCAAHRRHFLVPVLQRFDPGDHPTPKLRLALAEMPVAAPIPHRPPPAAGSARRAASPEPAPRFRFPPHAA